MVSIHSSGIRLTLEVLATLSLATALAGQQASPAPENVPLVTDWSHHHLVYSDMENVPMHLRQEPRYWQQWARHHRGESEDREFHEHDRDGDRRHHQQKAFKRDWSMSLGPGGTVGAGQYPAKFSFGITAAHCGTDPQPDYVAFNTSVAGSATQATIVAFDNLYTGCSGIVPSTYWAYNTGGKVVTSTVLSVDGSQVAFVQSVSNQAQLVLLKWAPSTTATSTNPDPISNVSASQYSTCTAPCMTAIPFLGGANDTNSAPFPDYSGDAIYVGDDAGVLHKFAPIFRGGTPGELATGWPVPVAAGLKLNSPVYDHSSGRVFVGSAFTTTGSQLFSIIGATGVVSGMSSSLGKAPGIVAGSMVDSAAGKVFVFLGNDGTTNCASSSPCEAVYQFSTNFTSGSGVKATVGNGGSFPLYNGAFDNAYFTSGNGTGNLVVCGGSFSGLSEPTIYTVPITAGTMSPPAVSGAALASSNVACSPVTDVLSPQTGVDRMFASVRSGSSLPACSSSGGGCVLNLVSNTWQASKAFAVGQAILDRFNNIQVVAVAGMSGVSPPSWQTTCGVETPDNGVTWVNITPFAVLAWQANTFWSVGFPIHDSNQNIECALNNGPTIESGATPPTWNTTIGGITNDFTQQWRNGGPLTTHALSASGGTSGIIIDNSVAPGALGTSEVYFSTLGTGNCGAGNGCAIQASQAALQ